MKLIFSGEISNFGNKACQYAKEKRFIVRFTTTYNDDQFVCGFLFKN
jgi:hypothetical protein